MMPSLRAYAEGTVSAQAFVFRTPRGVKALQVVIYCGVHQPPGNEPFRVFVVVKSYQPRHLKLVDRLPKGAHVRVEGRMSTTATMDAGEPTTAKSIIVLDAEDNDAVLVIEGVEV